MYTFHKKLKGLKERDKQWNTKEFANSFADKKIPESHLQEVQVIGMNDGYTTNLKMEEFILCSKIEERERKEEIRWRQNSKNQWLKEGERKTKLFQHSVIQNMMQKKIFSIKNSRGG